MKKQCAWAKNKRPTPAEMQHHPVSRRDRFRVSGFFLGSYLRRRPTGGRVLSANGRAPTRDKYLSVRSENVSASFPIHGRPMRRHRTRVFADANAKCSAFCTLPMGTGERVERKKKRDPINAVVWVSIDQCVGIFFHNTNPFFPFNPTIQNILFFRCENGLPIFKYWRGACLPLATAKRKRKISRTPSMCRSVCKDDPRVDH